MNIYIYIYSSGLRIVLYETYYCYNVANSRQVLNPFPCTFPGAPWGTELCGDGRAVVLICYFFPLYNAFPNHLACRLNCVIILRLSSTFARITLYAH